MDCLVQVNISLEDSKHGLLAEDVEAFVKEVSLNYNNIRIVGLMGMAPFEAEPEQTRPYFKKLKTYLMNCQVLNFVLNIIKK